MQLPDSLMLLGFQSGIDGRSTLEFSGRRKKLQESVQQMGGELAKACGTAKRCGVTQVFAVSERT